MKDNDGMLALLQDIKELLWGIALLMIGGFLCLIETVGSSSWCSDSLPPSAGVLSPIMGSATTKLLKNRIDRRPP